MRKTFSKDNQEILLEKELLTRFDELTQQKEQLEKELELERTKDTNIMVDVRKLKREIDDLKYEYDRVLKETKEKREEYNKVKQEIGRMKKVYEEELKKCLDGLHTKQ